MSLDDHQLDADNHHDEDDHHDEDECELCIEQQETTSCACRCGKCCEIAIVEASFHDAEREPCIAENGMPLMDDKGTTLSLETFCIVIAALHHHFGRATGEIEGTMVSP